MRCVPTRSDLRYDPLRGEHVIITPGRGERPTDFAPRPLAAASTGAGAPCPFCGIHQGTAPYVSRAKVGIGSASESIWSVDNLYPAVGQDGWHEVIIETVAHRSPLHTRPIGDVAALLMMWRDRARAMTALGAAHVALFRNAGPRAGASLSHPHSQALGAPFVPGRIAREAKYCLAHHAQTGRCLVCEMMAAETADGRRVVAETPDFLVVCPNASRYAYETWFIPRHHGHRHRHRHQHPAGLGGSFLDASQASLAQLATLLVETTGRLRSVLGPFDFNITVQLPPSDLHGAATAHWRLELTPRTQGIGGYEHATGCWMNPTRPEDAAERLRDQEIGG